MNIEYDLNQPASDGALRFPLLGLDVSERRIGLAFTAGPDALPQPLFTYARKTRAQDLTRCAEWVQQYSVATVVLGLPLNMDGSAGPRAAWMQRFARELQQCLGVPVLLHDERLTTVEADELLMAQGLNREAREERRDAVAAALILQRLLGER